MPFPYTYPPAIYPNFLKGLGYSVKWKHIFFNQSQKTVSGASIDIGLAATPLHQFDLTYNFLRGPVTYGELQNLSAFYTSAGGSIGRFAFDNPDDHNVTGQLLGTGDNVTNQFLIGRNFGLGAYPLLGTFEPIGMIDTSRPHAVYVNGVPQTEFVDYSFGFTQALNQKVVFPITPPPVGQDVTIDCYYWYWVRFADDSFTFEKFLNNIWTNQKVTLQSVRLGA